MQHHIIKSLAVIVMGAMLFSGCMVEKPTVKNYRRVSAMPELTPVTVEQLRQLIATDTTHYKVVVLTSPCCGYCVQSMRDVYPRKMAECDSSLVRWYFVVESYSSAQYADELYRTYHIDSPRYWIDDTLPQYRPLMVKNMWTVVWNFIWHYGQSFEEVGYEMADNRLNNIVNAIALYRRERRHRHLRPHRHPQHHRPCDGTGLQQGRHRLIPPQSLHPRREM